MLRIFDFRPEAAFEFAHFSAQRVGCFTEIAASGHILAQCLGQRGGGVLRLLWGEASGFELAR